MIDVRQSEVTNINKQKFLAELGKLLTFMYEEDRQAALAMYVKMFEDAEDEQALIQALISPTRQAVIVARAYNAKERKLQVEAQAREDTGEQSASDGTADFMLAIHQVYQDSVPTREGAAGPIEDQFSLFEEGPQPEKEALAEETVEETAQAVVDAAAEEIAPAVEPAPEAEDAAAPVSAPAVIPIPAAPAQKETVEEPVQSPPPAEAVTEPAPEEPAPVLAAETPAEPEQTASADQVEQFLADFSITDPTLVPMTDARETPAAEPEAFAISEYSAPPVENVGFSGFAPILDPSLAYETAPSGVQSFIPVPSFSAETQTESISTETPAVQDEPEAPAAEDSAPAELPGGRKLRPLVLILFLLFAIPLTLLGVALLLIPTLFFLLLGLGILAGGAAVLVSAFSGFPVFADIMLLLGAALIILALGLLCLWVFVWFLGVGIVGLIRSVISLGRHWCYKEVSA